MTPYFADDWLAVYQGDARAVLAELPAESVHCVMTSPPYWGLRDYGVPGQLGLEPTPEKYVANMVAVFREVRRVLRADGTVWLNLGDSYAGSRGGPNGDELTGRHETNLRRGDRWRAQGLGLRPKDLVGIPWRVAFALQADGWYLRQKVTWCKPNPMPESVTDRPASATEELFLLSKSARYFYDDVAVREASIGQNDHDLTGPGYATPGQTPQTGRRLSRATTFARSGPVSEHIIPGQTAAQHRADRTDRVPPGRNLRNWWVIATQPYPGAHFATFPEKLVEPCVKAGTSERGVCPECEAPWGRETVASYDAQGRTTNGPRSTENRAITAGFTQRLVKSIETTGWRPSCKHYPRTAEWPALPPRLPKEMVDYYTHRIAPQMAIRAELLDAWTVEAATPATVLDPFAGSGTVGLVAQRLGRRAVLIDLSMTYLSQLMDRNRQKPLGLTA